MRALTALTILCALWGCNATRAELSEGFASPPDWTRPAVYWYFISGHIEKEGITRDLEAMKSMGVGEAFIGDIYLKPPTSNSAGITADYEPGATPSLSDKWFDCMRHAVREGTRLGIDIGFFNSPGWSQSGGPWIEPQDAMRYLTMSRTEVAGPGRIETDIAGPGGFFQDVALLAVPCGDAAPAPVAIDSPQAKKGTGALADGNPATVCTFDNKKGGRVVLDFTYACPLAARSLTLHPTLMHFRTKVEVSVPDASGYRTIASGNFDHGHSSLQRGPKPDGEMVLALGGELSDKFRVTLSGLPAGFELSGAGISASDRIEYVTEKWLNKMPNKNIPLWEECKWTTRMDGAAAGAVPLDEVIDLSGYFDGQTLVWPDAPPGKWELLRIGMTTTGTLNTPANPTARGLEMDKMNRRVIGNHFDSYVGRIMSGLSPEESRSLKRVIADSYETGPQNWTDGMRDSFIAAYGYDPLPWLATLTGRVVGSPEESDRFLWDLRRLVADMVADQYVAGLREESNGRGLKLWLENYGHWGFPSEALRYGGASDDVAGEFWIHSQNIECRLAASAAHTYGKQYVWAESYTSAQPSFTPYPGMLKRSGDWSYTQGVNRGVLHVYVHQPYNDRAPGINPWYGTEFHRHNTWTAMAAPWVDYLRRCYFMLGQGTPVADVAYFIGEDAPVEDGWTDRTLAAGYDYDFINAEVIMERMSVKNGRWTLPDGVSYAVLALPPLKTMRLELLERLCDLVRRGGILVGQAPQSSPSLQNYPHCDERVRELAGLMWGDGTAARYKVGKGMVFTGSPGEALASTGVGEDLAADSPQLGWKHRSAKEGEIYFLANLSDSTVEAAPSFRVSGLLPELWNPVDGTRRALPQYGTDGARTVIPMKFAPGESCFVVFSKNGSGAVAADANYPEYECAALLADRWDVRFTNADTGDDFTAEGLSAGDWREMRDERIKHFSGTGTYTASFDLDSLPGRLFIEFSQVDVIASVTLNGRELGTLWTPPWRIEATEALRKGSNTLTVEVANLWVNRLAHDAGLPEEERHTWLLTQPVGKFVPQRSGLSGEVKLLVIKK